MFKKLIYLMTFVLLLAVTGTASADQDITVPDAGFDDQVIPAGSGYTYIGDDPWGGETLDYPGPWQTAGGDAWIQNNYYDELQSVGGDNFLYAGEGAEDTVYQILDETFIEGATYTLSVWAGVTWDGYGTTWVLNFTGEDYTNDLIEASGDAPMGSWEQASLEYTATAADAGNKIGIKMKGPAYFAFDEVTLSYNFPIAVPDGGFDDIVLAAESEYTYIGEGDWAGTLDYPGPWLSAGGDAWIQNQYYDALQAVGGDNFLYAAEMDPEDSIYQLLDETFIEDAMYTLSVWVGQAWDGYGTSWALYFTGEDYTNELIEASGDAPVGSWEQVSLEYTATAADAGNKIGIKFKGVADLSVDEVTLSYFIPTPLLTNGNFEADLALVPNPGDTDASSPTGWEYDRYYGYDVDPWLMNVSAIGDGSGGDVGVVLGTWNADGAWAPVVAAYPESAVEAGNYKLEVTTVSTGGAGEGWLDVQLGWIEDPADPWANYDEFVREWTDVSLFGDGVWTTLTWDFKIPGDDPSIGMNWYLWLRGESYDDYVIVGKAKLATVFVNIATKPYPDNDEEGVLIGSTLSWEPIENGVTRDVYFGTSSPPAFVGNQEGTSYYPGLLDTNTTYYWQIDEVVGTMVNTGDIWSFTTGSSNVRTDTVISVQNDDGEDHIHYGDTPDDGAEARDSSDLEMPWEGDAQTSSYQVIGLRFVDMPILKGTPISDVYVQFKADNENLDGGPVNLIISGLLQPDTGELGSGENFYIDRNPKTTAEVKWTDIPEWTSGEATDASRTPDISSIIQEIVNQDGWVNGNALMLFIRDDKTNPSADNRSALSGTAVLHVPVSIAIATQPGPADGAEDVPLDATLSWWPGIKGVSHNMYLATSAMESLAAPPTYLVDGDSHSLPWVVADGTISFDGQIHDDGGDPDFISAGASGNTLDIPDNRNWAKLSFDFDVDFVDFIYGGNAGNITVQAKDSAGALIDSLYQADTSNKEPAGPVTLSGSGIRSLDWKSTSSLNQFAALDNILLTLLPPALIGDTTQVTFDPGVLTPSTTYYWQVDTVEADGTIHTGDVWSFTTVPGEATQPDPADKAVGVALDATLLSWTPGATAATHDVYFGTTSPPPLIGNQEDPNFDPGPLEMETTYYWQVDEIEADGTTVYTGDIWSFKTPRPGTGTIVREVWEGIGGTAVSDLTGSPDYPDNPTWSDEITSFDTPVDFADDFGSRVHGYLHPDTSGDYTFWIATDDNSELWLSTDESPANAVLISTVSNWAGHLDFDDPDVTPSGPISLEGGQKYYIMALYKEGGGGDNCAVAWEGPDSPTRAVIHGYFLSPYVPFKNTQPDPADGLTGVSKTLTLSWTPGGTAASHDVYFSADQQAVIDGTELVSVQTETSYSPAGLEKGVTYYWRVDAVEEDGTTVYTGDVWSFTVTTLGR